MPLSDDSIPRSVDTVLCVAHTGSRRVDVRNQRKDISLLVTLLLAFDHYDAYLTDFSTSVHVPQKRISRLESANFNQIYNLNGTLRLVGCYKIVFGMVPLCSNELLKFSDVGRP